MIAAAFAPEGPPRFVQRGNASVRILYVIDSMAPGGTEKQLAELITGLDRRRFEPLLCTLRASTMPLVGLDCRTIELGLHSFAAPATWARLATLRRFIVEQEIDIVQTFFQDGTLAGCCASMGTPVRARVACFRDLGFWRSPRKVWPLRLAYRWFDGFTANAAAVAAHVHAADGIPLSKITVIHNGVAIPVPRVEPAGVHPVVGIVANLNRPVKRVDLFLDAARLVAAEVPDARFTIVGDGPLRRELMAQAERLRIADVVRFAGQVQDTHREVSTFHVGVLTSDSEGLSNAILEYMAAGVPTVARNVGGNSELVLPDISGVLVSGATPTDIAAAVLRLLRDPAARQRLGSQARKIAETRYSMTAYVDRYQDYYDRLMGTAKDRVPPLMASAISRSADAGVR